MTFTDEERRTISDILGNTESSHHPWVIEQIEAAVLPAYTARVRAEALREAADVFTASNDLGQQQAAAYLRARADTEEDKCDHPNDIQSADFSWKCPDCGRYIP